MIKYQEQKLENGLTLITHLDKSTPLAVINVLYKVGSRNEHKDKTGFAHLFEHLMFGGSANVPDFDKILHRVGAENNAFTNTDITNYYIILNTLNIETALWVESDRMRNLTINQEKLNVQKNVVVEEFKQRYLNVPYGNAWLKLRPLAYQVHPYRWPTIGQSIAHIENATLDDVQSFYDHYYSPSNAVITIAGNLDHKSAADLVNHWFGDFSKSVTLEKELPKEPPQKRSRFEEFEAKVPMDALYKAYHMPARGAGDYIKAELISDLLGRGNSSRLHQSLVKEKQVFNSINAYITGSSDPGLLVISGKLNQGRKLEDAEKYIEDEIEQLKHKVGEEEIEKVVNQAVSSMYFSETELLNKAIALSVANSVGDTNLVHKELNWIQETTKEELILKAKEILSPEQCSTLYYRSNN